MSGCIIPEGIRVLYSTLMPSDNLLLNSVVVNSKLDIETTKFKFASYYGSHMVLQRAPRKTSVWGYANLHLLGKPVTVKLSTKSGSVEQTVKGYVRKGYIIVTLNQILD